MSEELTLPESYESQICANCGGSLYARRIRTSDAIANATSRDVAIACEECESVEACLDADSPDPDIAEEIAEAEGRL